MSKPLAGKRRFHAMGQRDEALGLPLTIDTPVMRAAPWWAQSAYLEGRGGQIAGRHAFFGLRLSRAGDVVETGAASIITMPIHYEFAPGTPHALRLAELVDTSTYSGLERQLRDHDHEATLCEGKVVNTVEVLTTLDPHFVQLLMPLGIKAIVTTPHRAVEEDMGGGLTAMSWPHLIGKSPRRPSSPPR